MIHIHHFPLTMIYLAESRATKKFQNTTKNLDSHDPFLHFLIVGSKFQLDKDMLQVTETIQKSNLQSQSL